MEAFSHNNLPPKTDKIQTGRNSLVKISYQQSGSRLNSKFTSPRGTQPNIRLQQGEAKKKEFKLGGEAQSSFLNYSAVDQSNKKRGKVWEASPLSSSVKKNQYSFKESRGPAHTTVETSSSGVKVPKRYKNDKRRDL